MYNVFNDQSLFFLMLDKLPHNLKFVKEVTLELSMEKGENKKVAM